MAILFCITPWVYVEDRENELLLLATEESRGDGGWGECEREGEGERAAGGGDLRGATVVSMS